MTRPTDAQVDSGRQTIQIGDIKRAYLLHVPADYDGKSLLPLVLNFHGTGGSAEGQMRVSALGNLADKEKFLIVAPVATYRSAAWNYLETWNADMESDGPNDIKFVITVIEDVIQKTPVDTQRIFLTGYSGGGRMSSRLACELSEQIAAIAPVAGAQFPSDCKPTKPVPIITFHGTNDGVNHYSRQDSSPPTWKAGVEHAVLGWANSNGCDKTPQELEVSTSVIQISFRNCDADGDVILYRIKGAGHTWPGSPLASVLKQYGLGETNMDIDASRLIWKFFEQHSLR